MTELERIELEACERRIKHFEEALDTANKQRWKILADVEDNPENWGIGWVFELSYGNVKAQCQETGRAFSISGVDGEEYRNFEGKMYAVNFTSPKLHFFSRPSGTKVFKGWVKESGSETENTEERHEG